MLAADAATPVEAGSHGGRGQVTVTLPGALSADAVRLAVDDDPQQLAAGQVGREQLAGRVLGDRADRPCRCRATTVGSAQVVASRVDAPRTGPEQ